MSSEGVRPSYTSVNLSRCQLLTWAGIKFDFRATLNPGSRGCSVSPTQGLTPDYYEAITTCRQFSG